ncbi:hypothetical protein WR25_04594 [Diploscapter pachys]|uniref:Uncharacterized protein n=1 Tax=Diploscapter pachys TaxID=2018661 RepID=A0A2A2LL60_9BILA|nr:hypothetical protein WR25_04594 [Diploscapter pachys]
MLLGGELGGAQPVLPCASGDGSPTRSFLSTTLILTMYNVSASSLSIFFRYVLLTGSCGVFPPTSDQMLESCVRISMTYSLTLFLGSTTPFHSMSSA